MLTFLENKIYRLDIPVDEMKKYFLMIFLPSVVLVGIVLLIFYVSFTRIEGKILEKNEIRVVQFQSEIMHKALNAIVSDLLFLSGQTILQKLAKEKKATSRKIVANEYLSFSKNKRTYDQIRFLDMNGTEIVRVNFNHGQPRIVLAEALQNKAKRHYFENTLQRKRGDVFISPFDLNLENGEIENPAKPVIRFGTPVFDGANQKSGIVILNYLGAEMLQQLERLSEGSLGQFVLLNSKGQWLKGLNPEDDWGYIYKKKTMQALDDSFPDAWWQINQAGSGQFYTAKGLFTFETILKPLSDFDSNLSGSHSWKVVSYVPPELLNTRFHQLLFGLLILYGLLSIGLSLLSWYFATALMHRKTEALKRQQTEKDLKLSLQEKVVLLQEIHHRVKNNLQVISSLLKIQARYIEDKETLAIFQESKDRIHAMSAIHETLYQSDDLANIHTKDYIKKLVDNLFLSYGLDEIVSIIEVQDIPLRVDDAISCGLIINELVSNSLKYAFSGVQKGKITIMMSMNADSKILLTVSDNGVGLPENLDITTNKTMGLRLVHLMVDELQGDIQVDKHKGTQFQIQFVLTQPVVASNSQE